MTETTPDRLDRGHAQALDAADPLASYRGRFHWADPNLIYLDGNSLGMLPLAARERIRQVVDQEWGVRLIRGWNEGWMELPRRAGDLIGAAFLGTAAGQVAVCDSTSVNLYKLAAAGLDARPGRRVIVTDHHNFPTDRYVLQGLAASRNLELRMLDPDPVAGVSAAEVAAAVDEDTALVSLSLVDYRSGALADMAAVNDAARAAGALTLWDLCHAVGAVPIELDATGADLAVGCTYKYLNAGPGSPALLYVRQQLQTLRQPIWGWFGQRDQFAMGPEYDPVEAIDRFAVGTPSALGVALVEEGARLLADAGVKRLRAKGVSLTSLLVDLHDAWLAPLGFTLASPRDANARGSHVSLAHPEAYRICRALIEVENVIPDFRAPDLIRFGPAPITTRHVDVWDAMDRLRRLVSAGGHLAVDGTRARVT